ncbi:hypothetical protein [Nocardia sp. CNY236]|uniref:phage tail tube protein n=1 Tax=Nocardia sp. CNY236 TaxID=1169152 RepID=UPI00048BB424|nr:hypothetical protein [Nocardia sp. CNY236]
MAATIANVYAAMPKASGAVLRAPLGTAGPTSATDALDNAFVDCGFVGEEGFTESNTRETEKKKAFGGSTVKVLQTDYTATVKFAFLESTNADVLKAVFGDDNVTVDAQTEAITVEKNKKALPHNAWVIDTVDDAVGSIRTFIPNGQITAVEDIIKVHTDTIMYTITMECFEDASGTNIYEYINKSAG